MARHQFIGVGWYAISDDLSGLKEKTLLGRAAREKWDASICPQDSWSVIDLFARKRACKCIKMRPLYTYVPCPLGPPYHAFRLISTFLWGGIVQLFTPYHHRLNLAPMDEP